MKTNILYLVILIICITASCTQSLQSDLNNSRSNNTYTYKVDSTDTYLDSLVVTSAYWQAMISEACDAFDIIYSSNISPVELTELLSSQNYDSIYSLINLSATTKIHYDTIFSYYLNRLDNQFSFLPNPIDCPWLNYTSTEKGELMGEYLSYLRNNPNEISVLCNDLITYSSGEKCNYWALGVCVLACGAFVEMPVLFLACLLMCDCQFCYDETTKRHCESIGWHYD